MFLAIGRTIKKIGQRIAKSNNRLLGTLFGCLTGMVIILKWGALHLLPNINNLLWN